MDSYIYIDWYIDISSVYIYIYVNHQLINLKKNRVDMD